MFPIITMDILYFPIIQAIVVLCIIGVFSYFDVKYREIPMKTVKWLPVFYGVSLTIFYGCFCLCLIYNILNAHPISTILPVITAVLLPFLLWFFGKGKVGAIDSRIMTMVMLVIPNLYFHMIFLTVLCVITVIMFVITKYLTKSYGDTTSDGEQKYIPQMVSIGVASLLMFIMWFIL